MLAFAAEAVAALMLAPRDLWKTDVLFWSWFLSLAMLVTPLLWMVFVVSFLSDGEHHRQSLRSRLILAGTFVLAMVSILVLAWRQTIGVLRVDGVFQAMVFDVVGRAGIVMQLLATVGLLIVTIPTIIGPVIVLVRLYFTTQVVIVDRRLRIDALRASWELTRGFGLRVFGAR